jgi:hypothetical protein
MHYSSADAIFLRRLPLEYDENIKDGDEPLFDDSIYEITVTERSK